MWFTFSCLYNVIEVGGSMTNLFCSSTEDREGHEGQTEFINI